MRRYLLIIILFLFLIPSSFAQKLKVESFAISEGDLSAVTPARLDENDRNCALIKVGIALDGVQFEGNVMGNVIPKLGEYWVYMPQGSRQMKVLTQSFLPVMVTFADYGIEKIGEQSNVCFDIDKTNVDY